MKITKHGQSCIYVEAKGKKILIDPGIYAFGADHENLDASDYLNCDLMIITHEHQDHFDIETVKRLLDAGVKLLATNAVCQEVKDEMPDAKCEQLKEGTVKQLGEITITGFLSKHGPLPTGGTPPEVIGIVMDDGEKRLYAPGDTTELNTAVSNVDVAFIPICGQVVMSIEEARDEIEELKPGLSIPYHYDNPRFPVDVHDFAVTMDGSEAIKILQNGQTIEV